jgi:histidinol-phosphate aminotransferase
LKFEDVQNEIQLIVKERENLEKSLETISYVSKIYPSDANFILIKVDDANLRYRQLIEKGIVIRNRTTQALCENTLRLTIGTTEENKKLIKVLKAI